MATTHESVPTDPTITPAERLRLLGQEMGLWSRGFDFARVARQLFRDIDLRNKAMLEIGCGKGLLCLWAALHDARHVVGLEPLAEGAFDSVECHQAFESMARQLALPQARILPVTVQAYDGPKDYFDIVLSVASINHLDEKSVVALGESAAAIDEYQNIFRNIASMMRRGGTLIVMDAGRRNLFGDLGVRNPMLPRLEWFKHQQPELWANLVCECGFGDPEIRWASGRLLRYAGIDALPRMLSYCGRSMFRLEVTRNA